MLARQIFTKTFFWQNLNFIRPITFLTNTISLNREINHFKSSIDRQTNLLKLLNKKYKYFGTKKEFISAPKEVLFSKSHEWILNTDKYAAIGISFEAQDLLGDIVFVELPEVGKQISRNEEFGVVESVKSASDLYAPISFEVLEINSAVVSKPELVNKDPYNQGWLLRVKPLDVTELDTLMNEDAYLESLKHD